MPAGVLLYHTHNSFPFFGEWGADIPGLYRSLIQKNHLFSMLYAIYNKNKRVEKLYKYHKQAETLVKQHKQAKSEKTNQKTQGDL